MIYKKKVGIAPIEKAAPKPDYLSNKAFYKELMACQKKGVMSNALGKMFILLANKYSSHWRFSQYTYRDELVGNGIKACCEAFMKFNCKKSHNAFAFYTMCIHNAFLQILNREKRHQRIRDQLLVDFNMDPSNSYLEFLETEDAISEPAEKEEVQKLIEKLGAPSHEFTDEEAGELDKDK